MSQQHWLASKAATAQQFCAAAHDSLRTGLLPSARLVLVAMVRLANQIYRKLIERLGLKDPSIGQTLLSPSLLHTLALRSCTPGRS